MFLLVFMGILMAAALVGMVVCAKKQSTNPKAKPAAVALLIIVIICAIVILHQTDIIGTGSTARLIENEMKYAGSSTEILGKYLAEKYPDSKVLLVIDREFEENQRQKTMIESLKKGFNNKISITATVSPLENIPDEYPEETETVPSGPEGTLPPLMEMTTAADFDALVEKNAGCDMIISLIGLPMDAQNMALWQMPDETRPKVALVSSDIFNLKNAIKAGFIVAVVAYSPQAVFDESRVPADPQKVFDRRYLLITPENVDEMEAKHNGIFVGEPH